MLYYRCCASGLYNLHTLNRWRHVVIRFWFYKRIFVLLKELLLLRCFPMRQFQTHTFSKHFKHFFIILEYTQIYQLLEVINLCNYSNLLCQIFALLQLIENHFYFLFLKINKFFVQKKIICLMKKYIKIYF